MTSLSIYKPLDKTKKQIRILHLLPGTFDDDIRCDLSVEPVQTNFEALSYVWGDVSFKQVIQVQGQQISVTTNVELALRHIRSPTQTRRLWVDAVCINQTDNNERNHQVGMMAAIYKGAERVLVWLGLNTGNIRSLEAIQQLSTNPDLHWDTENEPNSGSGAVDSVLDLINWLRNDWYTRIWTLQEALLAKSLVYICGSFVFHKDEIDCVLYSFFDHFVLKKCCHATSIEGEARAGNLRVDLYRSLQTVAILVEFQRGTGSSPFLDIASAFRYRLATNPRDKVYGVLGLANDISPNIIDYNLSITETYLLTTISHMESTGNLDVLSHVLPRSEGGLMYPLGRIKYDLPTWVPDWSDHRPYEYWRLMALRQRQALTKLYSACRSTSISRLERHSPTSLGLDGFFCDEITELSPPMHCEQMRYDPEVLEDWRMIAGVDNYPERPYISGSTLLDAYWRTLCMDIDPRKGTAEPRERADLDTRALNNDWWWEHLQQRRYEDVPGLSSKLRTNIFDDFTSHVAFVTSGRRLFKSNNCYLGLAPEDAQKGDQVWILCGGRLPLILRCVKEESGEISKTKYQFVGDSYVHGIMDGEFVKQEIERGTEPRPVVLI
ncbi:hypothetical protein FZEAL_8900 [Fusarium zealandicum]|uniref:Heterokaryon incompatibility domain-containing protein n=1 Tax=Fusarium zealandicum TaxID=1053134 RepID=A0A8H4UD05_9HYPO|nr:hypothetical protein FZEAL_8900 [Fusarium zealandicum]